MKKQNTKQNKKQNTKRRMRNDHSYSIIQMAKRKKKRRSIVTSDVKGGHVRYLDAERVLCHALVLSLVFFFAVANLE